MAEAEPAPDLTTRDAVEAIARATAFDEPLRRRVEGATWMVWGLVTAGVALTTNALEGVFGFPGPWWVQTYPLLWLLAGAALTTGTWRIAALARPGAHPGRLAGVTAILAVVGLLAAIWVPATTLLPGPGQAALVVASLAVPWLALALLNPHRGTLVGRRVMATIGLALVVAALLWLPFVGGLPHGAFRETMLVAALAGGAAPLFGGLWQVLRG